MALCPYILDARLGLRVSLEHAFTCVSTTNQAERHTQAPLSSYLGGSTRGLQPGSSNTNISVSSQSSNYYGIMCVVRPKWQMYITALHETLPGRHLQVSLLRKETIRNNGNICI